MKEDLKKLSLDDLANRIDAHLRRIEAKQPKSDRDAGRGFYGAGAYRAGRFVKVRYVSYQGTTALTKSQAACYLTALDGGFKGKHFGLKTLPGAFKTPAKFVTVFRTDRYPDSAGIEVAKAVRVTSESVVLWFDAKKEERRVARHNQWGDYWTTRAEAVEHVRQRLNDHIATLEEGLADARKKLKRLK